MKSFLKHLVPRPVLDAYYRAVEWMVAARFGFPSRKLVVIGVTGTKGKSTVVHLIGTILEEAGYKIGWISSVSFNVAGKELPNKLKMTMPSRGRLQRLLDDMVKARCRYAVVETSSEGLAQWRHAGIAYDVAVFTNLSPEHIESHGSFTEYQRAKGRLFKSLSATTRKLIEGVVVDRVSVINKDDGAHMYFESFSSDRKMLYSFSDMQADVRAKNVILGRDESSITLATPQGETNVKLFLLGQMGVENALAASSVAISQGVQLKVVARALAKIRVVPGRMERIDEDQDFEVFVDYAHEPKSLKAVYQTLKSRISLSSLGGAHLESQARLICVLGAAGGGRDKWKRPVMGELARTYCDEIIITNEDPYDEDPQEILAAVASGASGAQGRSEKNMHKILSRKEALTYALDLARSGDTVIVTGKGSEGVIMGAGGSKTSWDDRAEIRKILANIREETHERVPARINMGGKT